MSDEICKENHLSVIEDHSSTKGKSHFEWEVDKLNLSWKAKLKQAIDEVVMISDDFADFLKKCADHGIIVEYNPEHKIDIKFMLAEQKERNPRAKMTRGRTLGWFYEGKQIAKRIENYKKYMNYKPNASIIRTSTDKFLDTPALSMWAERENMKAASKAINEMTATNSTLEELEKAAHSAFSKRMERTQRMNAINSRLKELEQIIPLLEKYHEYQEIYKTYRSMAEGRQKKKYGEKCSYEIGECRSAASELRKFYPDGNVPSLKSLKKEQDRLLTEYEQVSSEYKFYKKESDRISKDAQKKRSSEKVVRQFIENEKETERRRKNRNGLE